MFYIYVDGAPLYYPLNERLTVLSPKLTLELGKAGSLAFKLPPTNQMYQRMQTLKTIVTVESDDKEIFRGRLVSYPKDFSNIKDIYCEGDLAYLVDSEQENAAYKGNVHGLFTRTVNAHNARMEAPKRFLIGNITVENRPVLISGISEEIEDAETGDFNYKQIAINAMSREWKKTLDYLQSYMIDYCGGYLRTRRVGNNTYLDYLESYGTTTQQEIEFGVNLLDLVDEDSVDDIVTVLIPLGDDNLKVNSVNGGSDEIIDQEAVDRYGRIVRTKCFDGVNDPSTLLENGRRFLERHSQASITVTIKAIDLSLVNPDIEEIHLGDRVHVKSAPHGIVDTLTCSRIEYDLENPANTIYTFGVPKQTLTERYKKDKMKAEETTEQVAATSAGGGGSGASKKTDKELERAYTEWVDWDPENPDGHVSIGAFYKEWEGKLEKLKSEVGIDLSATPESSNVNIKALYEKTDTLSGTVSKQGATIDAFSDETKAQLALHAGWYKKLDERENGHYAWLVLKADELESSVNMKADKINMDASLTRIYETLDGVETDIASFSRSITSINSEITSVRKLIAEEIEAVKANIDWLKVKAVTATWLYAIVGVSAPYVYQGGRLVATQEWVDAALEARGYLTDNGVSWGNVSSGFVWLNVDGTSKYLAMGNHTHSQYLTSLPSHRHYFSGSCTFGWGHTHSNSGKGGVNNYSNKTVTISGNTSYS